ncbi:MAG TPA: hypothetical protein VHU80_08060 [Polyangiaceae bacterium]|jgi:hypothetical protein|nr:hypothetical protein [Polyangiaceae bacterium]
MLRRSLLAVALGALSFSCAGLDRAEECRQVATVVNPILATIDHSRAVVKAPTYRLIATKYEELANATGLVKIRNKHVSEAVNDYQRMLHEAARDARAFGDALEANDESRLLLARTTAARTVRHEATALARMDNACRGR